MRIRAPAPPLEDAGPMVAGRPPAVGRRTSLTGRAAVLALVVCMLAISLAYPLRDYLAQRGQITDYRTRVAEAEKRVTALQEASRRWRDPDYVEAQARQRLHYVLPGEVSYTVLEADDEPPPVNGVLAAVPPSSSGSPWFADLWHSVEAAGKG